MPTELQKKEYDMRYEMPVKRISKRPKKPNKLAMFMFRHKSTYFEDQMTKSASTVQAMMTLMPFRDAFSMSCSLSLSLL
jgi:hypothetical protein